MLSQEYQAAVDLGYISQEAAERKYARLNINKIDRDDVFQRKSFFAGYLFMNFKFEWDVTEKDMSDAKHAWNQWCDYQEPPQ